MQIVPGILTNNLQLFKQRVGLAQEAAKKGLIEWAQVDLIDGVFAEELTVFPSDLDVWSRKYDPLKFEAHLMVSKENLEDWLWRAIQDAGVDRGIIQIESVGDQLELVKRIRACKACETEVGFSLDVETPVSVLDKEVLKKLDVIQIMTVKTGASGQKLMPEMLEKVRHLVEMRRVQGLGFRVEVDGGVNLENIKQLRDLGVDLAEVNSGLYNNRDFIENSREFYQQIKTG